MSEEAPKNTTDIYAIKVQGHVDTRWSEWFYGMTITHGRDGTTTLCGPLPDQIVLHSVLDRIRDMNLRLISVNPIVSDEQTSTDEAQGVSHDEDPVDRNLSTQQQRNIARNSDEHEYSE